MGVNRGLTQWSSVTQGFWDHKFCLRVEARRKGSWARGETFRDRRLRLSCMSLIEESPDAASSDWQSGRWLN